MRAWAGGHRHGRWAVWAAPCTLLTLVRFAGFAGYFEGKVPSGRREFIFFLTPGKKRNLLEALGLSGGPGGANPAWPARRQERRHRHRPTVGGADRYRTLVSIRVLQGFQVSPPRRPTPVHSASGALGAGCQWGGGRLLFPTSARRVSARHLPRGLRARRRALRAPAGVSSGRARPPRPAWMTQGPMCGAREPAMRPAVVTGRPLPRGGNDRLWGTRRTRMHRQRS